MSSDLLLFTSQRLFCQRIVFFISSQTIFHFWGLAVKRISRIMRTPYR
ncbi:hypothetical protein KKH3_36600 [Pectobacterium actinidiae]|nr:hypothetical protein KKH3_36600 [Pectobacterium actinidiae]